MRDTAFTTVKKGVSAEGAPQLILGPGSGLGQALLMPGGQVVPTEGGHIGFAPQTDEEIGILRFMMQSNPRIFVEQILSGPGLVNIHNALRALDGAPSETQTAAEITQAAVSKACPYCVRTVDLFCTMLGRVVGDMVLATGARGGVYLGGGILPKIEALFLSSEFISAFLDKGSMRGYLEPVSVRLIREDETALCGAAAALYDPAL